MANWAHKPSGTWNTLLEYLPCTWKFTVFLLVSFSVYLHLCEYSSHSYTQLIHTCEIEHKSLINAFDFFQGSVCSSQAADEESVWTIWDGAFPSCSSDAATPCITQTGNRLCADRYFVWVLYVQISFLFTAFFLNFNVYICLLGWPSGSFWHDGNG